MTDTTRTVQRSLVAERNRGEASPMAGVRIDDEQPTADDAAVQERHAGAETLDAVRALAERAAAPVRERIGVPAQRRRGEVRTTTSAEETMAAVAEMAATVPEQRPGSGSAIPELFPEAGKKSLSVLIVTSEAPPVVSGISKTVAMLLRGLTEQGHRVDVVSRQDYPRFMRGEFRLSAFAFYWPALRRRLASYDVVNLHGPVPTISEVFLLLTRTVRKLNRPALIYTHHSDLAISKFERICGVYNRLVGQLAQSADAVVVSSNAYLGRMWRSSRKPVSVIPWAIESEPEAADRPTRTGGALKVLFVGQLRSYKGLHVLLDAVRGLTDVEVTIVGNGPLRGEVEARVARPDLQNVTLAGRLSDDELWQAYRTHDVVVLPSTTTAEAYGLVLAEGMAAGCVPVASALPGVRELASETGFAVPPGNAGALRRVFERLARNPELVERLSAASLARSRELSVEAMAGQYAEVFRTALDLSDNDRVEEALPDGWDSADELLDVVREATGVRRASLSLVPRGTTEPWAQVWPGDGKPSFRALAPVAAEVATTLRPTLIAPGVRPEPRIAELLHDAQLTSALLLPVRSSRHGVAVLALSTTDDDAVVLGRTELNLVLRLVVLRGARQSA
ncbi:glycosyltransferase [Nakamurella endophytica]|uniref:Glycosyltransferase involved in cell wall biosynthesis n=1 Tax=Nakamurella endophytica TaxID=1748367 RepID=A0A917SNN5_9ACTN|nr:glycosyltransferase [Nakamurella endophytica]GGL91424.1 hypothetical protein GCM10011594_08990 [Nakamurella endophytica]